MDRWRRRLRTQSQRPIRTVIGHAQENGFRMKIKDAIELLSQLPPDAPFCRLDPNSATIVEIVSIHRERTLYKSEDGHEASRDVVIYVR